MTLIEYLNKIKKDENNTINGNTKIYEIDIVKNLGNISIDFQNIFNNKDDLIVNKIPNMFDYYLKLIFKYIKKDIEKYQEKKENKKEVDENKMSHSEIKENEEKEKIFFLDEKIIQKLDEIFKKSETIIKKETLATAIRLFISLVLYREEEKDKDKRIKFNRKNIVDYLKGKDLWDTKIYKHEYFDKNLEEIKSLNIKIKEIL